MAKLLKFLFKNLNKFVAALFIMRNKKIRVINNTATNMRMIIKIVNKNRVY